MAPAVREPMLGYHPCSTGFLTCARDPGGGQCQAGSLTGAVASEKGSEGLKGLLRVGGKHPEGGKGGGGLAAAPTGGAGKEGRLREPGG